MLSFPPLVGEAQHYSVGVRGILPTCRLRQTLADLELQPVGKSAKAVGNFRLDFYKKALFSAMSEPNQSESSWQSVGSRQ